MSNNTTNKNVKFNFTDDGSLNKLKTQYDQYTSKVIESSKKFGFNSDGNKNTQQNKYIKDEINAFKESYDIQKKIFDERKRSYDDQLQKVEKLKQSLASINDKIKANPNNPIYATPKKRIEDALKDEQDNLKKTTRDALKGSGKRKWSTFEDQQKEKLGGIQDHSTRLEKLLEGSNLILRQILSQDREDALKQIKAIEKDENATPEEKLAASQAKNTLVKTPEKSLIAKLFQFENLRDGLKNITGVFSANDALAATKSAERAAGAAFVATMDALPVVGEYTGAGARVLTATGNIGFDQKLETFKTQQNLNKLLFSNQALTGREIKSNTDDSALGYSFLDNAQTANNLMRARGNSGSFGADTKEAYLLEKGLGISQDISSNILDLIRTNREGDKGLENIVGGALEAGNKIFKGDRTYLGEFFTKNFIPLQRSILKSTDSIHSGAVADVLNRFNSVGGMWKLQSQQGQANIEAIQSGLTNPSGDVADTLSFMALRRAMPGASMDDIMKERDKGLDSPIYLNAMLKQVAGSGGDKYGRTKQMFGTFPALSSYTAASELVDHYDEFGNISQSFLKASQKGKDKTQSSALAQTTTMDKYNAALTNAEIKGVFDKFATILLEIGGLLNNAFNGAVYNINPDSALAATFGSYSTTNLPKKPTSPTSKNTKYQYSEKPGHYRAGH